MRCWPVVPRDSFLHFASSLASSRDKPQSIMSLSTTYNHLFLNFPLLRFTSKHFLTQSTSSEHPSRSFEKHHVLLQFAFSLAVIYFNNVPSQISHSSSASFLFYKTLPSAQHPLHKSHSHTTLHFFCKLRTR